jgi:ABC-type histidine transport system ATPase subunit
MDFNFFDATKARLQYLDGVYQNKSAVKDKLQSTVRDLEKREILLLKTEKALKFLIDKLVKEDLSKMDMLVTYGLNTVFPDKNLVFKSSIEERGSKIKINLQTIFNGETVDPSSMSSISVIESLLLRMICIIKMKKARLLLMDETFDAVDSEYIENVGKLMDHLSKKLKLDALLVTHSLGFSDRTENAFKFTSKNNSLEISKLK